MTGILLETPLDSNEPNTAIIDVSTADAERIGNGDSLHTRVAGDVEITVRTTDGDSPAFAIRDRPDVTKYEVTLGTYECRLLRTTGQATFTAPGRDLRVTVTNRSPFEALRERGR